MGSVRVGISYMPSLPLVASLAATRHEIYGLNEGAGPGLAFRFLMGATQQSHSL